MSVATTDYLAAARHLPAGGVLRVDDVPWEEYENLLADIGERYTVRVFYDQGRMEIKVMSAVTTDYLAAIGHLPAGAVLRLDDVPWEEYENLLSDLGESYAVRIFYDDGRMEIMAPAPTHEVFKSVLHTLVTALRDELDIDIQSLGSTTLRREMKAAGAEPDDCFYVQNAALVISKLDFDFEHDPPPDLVVEVDWTSASLNRFPIYARLGVPEIWRVIANRLEIHLLVGDDYQQSTESRAFPFLSSEKLSDFMVRGLAEGERQIAKEFRAWVREHQRTAS